MTGVIYSAAPYHILSYGTLLGMTVFQSFVIGPVLFKVIDRQSFSAAQFKLWPIYFSAQAVLSVGLALTFPRDKLATVPSGLSGLFDLSSRVDSLAPIAITFLTSLFNLAVLLPAARKVMLERKDQVKRDGKEHYAAGPHSEEMKTLNKRFGAVHGASFVMNFTTFLSVVAYDFTLGARLQSVVNRFP